MEDERIKVIYFGPRPTGCPQAEFVARWRQHGELGMSMPLWRHIPLYKQHDALSPAESGVSDAGPNTAEDRFGGVGEWWVRDEAALAAMAEDADVARLRVDEEATFGRDIEADQLLAHERVAFDAGQAGITLFSLIQRDSALDREEFAERWFELGVRIAQNAELTRNLVRYVQNIARPETAAVDGIAELGFGGAVELEAFFTAPSWNEEIVPTMAEICRPGPTLSLLTRENLLYAESA